MGKWEDWKARTWQNVEFYAAIGRQATGAYSEKKDAEAVEKAKVKEEKKASRRAKRNAKNSECKQTGEVVIETNEEK